MFRPSFFLLVCAALPALAQDPITPAERAEGWRALFDGQSGAGWVAIGTDQFPKAGWTVREGELRLEKNEGRTPHLDLVTQEKFQDFDLRWEWKISEGGNSGLKYNLVDLKKGVGCEYQLIDDALHPDAKLHDGTRSTAGLYDVFAPAPDKAMKPAGEWNESRIVAHGDHVQHFLNGKLTLEYDFGSAALKAAVAESKFSKLPAWGVKAATPILLQDHGDEVAFRHLRIKTAF